MKVVHTRDMQKNATQGHTEPPRAPEYGLISTKLAVMYDILVKIGKQVGVDTPIDYPEGNGQQEIPF